MFRVTGPTAGAGGSFVGGDPSVPTPPTVVPPWWLTMIQEELVAVLAAANMPLNQSNNGQVIAAILQLIQTAGIAFASDADAIAGTSTTEALTPHSGNALVAARISAVVNGAPAALATLKQLADAIGDDPNFSATIAAALGARAIATRLVQGAGLATGGGDLTSDRVIQVLAAAAADVIAGTAGNMAITPQAFAGAGGANANGYWCAQPGGFVKQWGRVTVSASGTSSAAGSITFPQSFTDINSIAVNGNADDGANPTFRPMTVTFPGLPTLVGSAVQLDTTEPNVKIVTPRAVMWQAIGR